MAPGLPHLLDQRRGVAAQDILDRCGLALDERKPLVQDGDALL
jgi:hypothetical protein